MFRYTGQIGLFKILAESSVAAGVRRGEAVTADGAEQFVNEEIGLLNEVKSILKNSKDVISAARNLMEEKHQLEKKLEVLYQQQANHLKDELVKEGYQVEGPRPRDGENSGA